MTSAAPEPTDEPDEQCWEQGHDVEPLIPVGFAWRCRRCGHEWEDNDE